MLKRMACLTLLVLSITGCSTKTALSYDPVIQPQEEKGIELHMRDFDDARANNRKIGEMRNIYGMPLVSITTGDNVPEWVSSAFKVELKRAGYKIAEQHRLDGYIIEGKLIHASVDTYFRYSGHLAVEVFLKKSGQILFQKTYVTRESGGRNWGAQVGTCAHTLKLNLQQMCREFVADIHGEFLKEIPAVQK